MLSEFIPAPVFEGIVFLPALKLQDPAHAVFKLSEQILDNLQCSMASEGCFHFVS